MTLLVAMARCHRVKQNISGGSNQLGTDIGGLRRPHATPRLLYDPNTRIIFCCLPVELPFLDHFLVPRCISPGP